jgi:hypothetical protein
MLAPAKAPEANAHAAVPPAALAPAGEAFTLAELRAVLFPHAGLPLVFEYGGRAVQPGYHVTEVKSGSFSALDCGANPESWREAFIQLWDVNEDRAHMPTGKFLSIIGKVLDEVDIDQDTRLTFEVSDGVRPIELHRALAVEPGDNAVRVVLGNQPASCKPRDRWLREAGAEAQPCGESDAKAQGCCGPEARSQGGCA